MGKKFITVPLLEKVSVILKVSPSLLFYSGTIDELDDNILKRIDTIINEEMNKSSSQQSCEVSKN